MSHQFGPLRFLPGPNKGRYPNCHSLYVEGDTRVLIDPACARSLAETLANAHAVDEIWLSHYHEDHFMHMDLFEGCPLRVHPADAFALESLEAFFAHYGLKDPELVGMFTGLLHQVFHWAPRKATAGFADGECIDLGGVTAQVLHTPGHTAGHCAFYFEDERLLFLGDYDLSAFGPWYGDACSDIQGVRDSVERLRAIPAKVWVSCHDQGLFTEEPGELWDRYLAVIDEREAALLERLEQGMDLPTLVEERIVYKKAREPKAFYDWGESATLAKHLEGLVAQGRVVQERGVWRLAP